VIEFRDQIVFISGASNGIGKQLAIELAGRGAIVVGCGRSRERLVDTLKEIRKYSPKSLMIACDVGDAEQVRGMMAKVLGDFGRVDILINNAGIGMRQAFAHTPLEKIEAILRTNYLGAVYCTHEVLPTMIASGAGHIVNISSGAGKIGTLNMAAYCASKFAMNGWAESLYHELKPLGICVSLVCPGPVRTEFNLEFRDSEPKSPPALFVSPEAVARQVIRAIEQEKFEIVMPRWLALLCWIKGLMPGVFRTLAQRRFRRYVALSTKSGVVAETDETNNREKRFYS
jgi:short-subunit dehydrogenase